MLSGAGQAATAWAALHVTHSCSCTLLTCTAARSQPAVCRPVCLQPRTAEGPASPGRARLHVPAAAPEGPQAGRQQHRPPAAAAAAGLRSAADAEPARQPHCAGGRRPPWGAPHLPCLPSLAMHCWQGSLAPAWLPAHHCTPALAPPKGMARSRVRRRRRALHRMPGFSDYEHRRQHKAGMQLVWLTTPPPAAARTDVQSGLRRQGHHRVGHGDADHHGRGH